jgi:hypothetical protein
MRFKRLESLVRCFHETSLQVSQVRDLGSCLGSNLVDSALKVPNRLLGLLTDRGDLTSELSNTGRREALDAGNLFDKR